MKPISPIKDGGYTKGHFYEFADGQVTMRDSITSDIYAVHSYIPEGLVGVITSHIMHKILGDISLESATLTDVILPRVRPRPFDAKKITLDQKLTTLFSGFPYPDVTIKTLLNHRSGMKKYNYFCDDKANWGRNKTLTNKDLLNVIITKNIQ